MAYTRTTWVNNTSPALNAANLNKIEQGILDAHNAIETKQDKVTGKGLSTEDYTTAEKNKLANISAGAEVNVQSNWTQIDTAADDYIKNKPVIDSALNTTSTNAIQNAPVATAIEALQNAKDQLSIINTVSGSIAHFTDGADMPAKSVIVNIEPQQSGTGTPSPDNVRPISGWESVSVTDAGKNLLPPYAASQTKNGVTFTVNEDGTITANGTATKATVLYLSTNSDLWSSGQFILNGCPSGGSTSTYCLRMYHENATTYVTDTGSGITFSGEKQLTCALVIFSGVTVNNLVFGPMIRLASDTDPTYEPYNGTTTPVNLGRTVYGGTLDVVSGVLTVDRAMVDLGTLGWTFYEYVGHSGGYAYNLNSIIKKPSTASEAANVVCSKLKVLPDSDFGKTSYNDGNCIAITINGLTKVTFPDVSTAAELKSALSGTQLCYELATPQTYQLTPTQVSTLLGENNVWADAGDVSVDYCASPKLYIDSKFDELYALIQGGSRSIAMSNMAVDTEEETEEEPEER